MSQAVTIDAGEVESALAGLPGVCQAVAVMRAGDPDRVPDGVRAYYVPEDDAPPIVEIMKRLRAALPEHLVPVALVELERIPASVTGEVDLQELPDPAAVDADCYLAPRDGLEALMRRILADTLGREEDLIGVRDDFFSIGGSSVMGIHFVRRLSDVLNSDITFETLFRHQSIAELAAHLRTGIGPAAVIPRRDVADQTRHPLSFAQQGLWFIDCYEQGSDIYNVHLLYEVLDGTDLDVLERSILAVYERQEALRTIVEEDADFEPYQRVLSVEEAPLTVERVDVVDLDELRTAFRAEASRPFDLQREAPFRARCYLVGAGPDRQVTVAFVVHHIAFDGWSCDLLLTELGEFYEYFARLSAGHSAELGLPELSIRYRDFAAWQREQLKGERLTELLVFWRETLQEAPRLELPTDRPRPRSFDYRGAAIVEQFDRGLSAALRARAREYGVSLFSLMLAGWYLVVSRFSGQEELVFGVPAVNRRQSQTHDLIGCFVNSLPIDLRVAPDTGVAEAVAYVADRIRQAQRHQDLPFELLVGELSPEREANRHPVFQLWFDVHSFAETGADHQGAAARTRPSAPLRSHALDERNAGDGHETIARFDLGAVINDGHDALTGTFWYAVSMFDRATVKGLVDAYSEVLSGLAASTRTAPARNIFTPSRRRGNEPER